MKIVAPISRADEVGVLAEAGADELYCGLVPKSWTERFNNSGANRRIFGNLKSEEELARAAEAARAAGVRLSLVMNAQNYTGEQLDYLVAFAARFEALGGHALIVGDLFLLEVLVEAGLGLRLHLSSVASCRNSEAIAWYRDLGVDRVILPRDVTRREVARMLRRSPGVELEAFVLNDGCIYEEGVCHSIHLPGALGGPICLDGYRQEVRRDDGVPLEPAERNRFVEHEEDYRRWLWYRTGCGFSTTDQGLPYGPCGLCALPGFHAAGLTAIKIAGREAATERKRASVAMVRDIRDRVVAEEPEAAVREVAVSMRGDRAHCDHGYMCYYPR